MLAPVALEAVLRAKIALLPNLLTIRALQRARILPAIFPQTLSRSGIVNGHGWYLATSLVESLAVRGRAALEDVVGKYKNLIFVVEEGKIVEVWIQEYQSYELPVS